MRRFAFDRATLFEEHVTDGANGFSPEGVAIRDVGDDRATRRFPLCSGHLVQQQDEWPIGQGAEPAFTAGHGVSADGPDLLSWRCMPMAVAFWLMRSNPRGSSVHIT